MTALSEVKGMELAFSPEMYATAAHNNVPWMYRVEEHPSWPVLAEIPETVTVFIPLPGFTVRQLLELEKGKVVLSASPTADLVPLKIGSVRLVMGEFEMIDRNLALRVTRLA